MRMRSGDRGNRGKDLGNFFERREQKEETEVEEAIAWVLNGGSLTYE